MKRYIFNNKGDIYKKRIDITLCKVLLTIVVRSEVGPQPCSIQSGYTIKNKQQGITNNKEI